MRRSWTERGQRRPYMGIVLALAAASAAAGAGKITVRPAATVTGREIRLRDISDAGGALGGIVLGAAALPGRSCVLPPGDIRLRLRAARANPDLLSIPGPVTVTTEGGAVAGDALVAAATEALRKALPWPAADVTIAPVSVPRMPAFHGGGTPAITAGAPLLRSARSAVVPVTVSAPGGGETRTVEVALRVTVRAPAVVAARPIARHAVIVPEDVTLARVETSDSAAANLSDVIGKRAVNALPTGRRLAASDAEETPLLAANARVTVRVLSGAVEVAATGTTREEGRAGQTIRVRLHADPNRPGPAREVRARVADAETVVVEE